MSDANPLPNAKEVRDLLESLVGRDVEVATGAAMVDPNAALGALTGVYVDARMTAQALVLVDGGLAAYLGAAIGLVPARTAQAAVADGDLPADLAENAGEVLNVTASLFNHDDAPHLKLDRVHGKGERLPNDLAGWVLAYVRRLDLEVSVAGYGSGNLSVVVL
ncbi:hypothetical protein [Cellulomonas marina]|uniref:Uncharacterized protein n=1 Tax=Cellulomonas marina TaxID=988821 RepID=A0A1I1ASA1_9CELL|nr:hypothetical protein [Cellulomonas marina]GIG30420.1 hypothetical protein Cma02nite_30200 [Cellulomonas marina]SFB39358.1 hypothetical protein SAMN05421867_12047 [Cellulomonas marina]